jgi:hypothetical protein
MEISREILMDLFVFSAPEYERMASGMPLSGCIYVCMYASLAPERWNEFVLGVSDFWSLFGEREHSSLKIRGASQWPPKKNCCFLANGSVLIRYQ